MCRGGRHQFDELIDGADAPTACVAVGVHLAHALLRDRSNVSSDISIAVLAEPGQTLDGIPNVHAGYVFDARMIAQWSIQLLQEAAPGQTPREVVVPGCLTLGSPRQVERAGDTVPGVCAF